MTEPATPSIPTACFDASTPVNGHRISAQRQPVSNLRSQDRDQRSEIRCVEDESSSVSGLQSPISALRQTSLTARVSRRRLTAYHPLTAKRPQPPSPAVGLHALLGDPAPDRANLTEPATPSIPVACFDASTPVKGHRGAAPRQPVSNLRSPATQPNGPRQPPPVDGVSSSDGETPATAQFRRSACTHC